mmetsp:Transcript_27359/g.40815  ORF Transcript_27359/g.40815 Transcript_27359/m.40815 type:complete len:269 (+) Transcript_27359:132-938(+)
MNHNNNNNNRAATISGHSKLGNYPHQRHNSRRQRHDAPSAIKHSCHHVLYYACCIRKHTAPGISSSPPSQLRPRRWWPAAQVAGRLCSSVALARSSAFCSRHSACGCPASSAASASSPNTASAAPPAPAAVARNCRRCCSWKSTYPKTAGRRSVTSNRRRLTRPPSPSLEPPISLRPAAAASACASPAEAGRSSGSSSPGSPISSADRWGSPPRRPSAPRCRLCRSSRALASRASASRSLEEDSCRCRFSRSVGRTSCSMFTSPRTIT